MVKVIAAGDALYSSRNLEKRIDPKIVKVLKEADTCFLNVEFQTPKHDTPPTYNKMYLTSIRPEAFDDLKSLNFEMLSIANNHTTEFGWKGLLDTLEEVEKRSLTAIGVGRSLDDAKMARFYDAPTGRVGFVCASSTGSQWAMASNNGAHTPARPGLLPLRWAPSYVLPEEQFKQLDAIDKLLGTRNSMQVNADVEIKDLVSENRFSFGHIFEANLTIVKAEEGEKAHVRTTYNQKDAERILRSVEDCVQRSHLPIFSLHTHEGDLNNWYTHRPPHFIQKIARQSIDAGAKAFIGHGAHMLRGVQMYKGRPIFWNVGSFLMEFEIGDSFIGPEMYITYGIDPETGRPSDLHNTRSYGPNGENIGFRGGRKFSVNIMVELEIDEDNEDSFTFKIIPIDLGLDTRTNKLKRGLPEWASPEVAKFIVNYLEEASAEWGTKFRYDEETGYIHVVV